MYFSIGYHTFSISKLLTQEKATILFNRLKELVKNKELFMIPMPQYGYNSHDRYYKFTYNNNQKGITWIIKFGESGFYRDGELLSCGIKAIINPKILIGENTYIIAATAAHMSDIEYLFNMESRRISHILGSFYSYSITRVDYCINFNVSKLIKGCPDSLKPDLPPMIMQLIKKGDVPDHFEEAYDNIGQFYLKSNSVVVNCYWKYYDLKNNYPDCISLRESLDVIRFEVQCKYPKMCTLKTILKNKAEVGDKYTLSAVSRLEDDEFSEDLSKITKNDKVILVEKLLSDKRCFEIISNYYDKTIKPGDYYSLKEAKIRINEKVPSWQKAQRLIEVLEFIDKQGGIANAKKELKKDDLELFRRSLRELKALKINPVVIPQEWGIAVIPNLLDKYCQIKAEEEINKIELM